MPIPEIFTEIALIIEIILFIKYILKYLFAERIRQTGSTTSLEDGRGRKKRSERGGTYSHLSVIVKGWFSSMVIGSVSL